MASITMTLLISLTVSLHAASVPDTGSGNQCSFGPCGANADCRSDGTTPFEKICTCPDGYLGDPWTVCYVDPCQESPCGVNAECSANITRAVCRCIQEYTGDPFIGCSPCSEDPLIECNPDPCRHSPCGANAECTRHGSRAVCKCFRGYTGDPFTGCRLEPCTGRRGHCGVNAECENNGTKEGGCKCRDGYEGDPFVRCEEAEIIFDVGNLCPPGYENNNFECQKI